MVLDIDTLNGEHIKIVLGMRSEDDYRRSVRAIKDKLNRIITATAGPKVLTGNLMKQNSSRTSFSPGLWQTRALKLDASILSWRDPAHPEVSGLAPPCATP